MSDKKDRQETVKSRAKTEQAAQSVPPSSTHKSDAVTDLAIDLSAFASKPKPTQKDTIEMTGPVDIPPALRETKSPGRCIVPQIASDKTDMLRRNSVSAKYMSDYVKDLMRMGTAHFQLAHEHPFLVGVGTIGEVQDAPRSTRDTSTREVFIENIDAAALTTPVLASRVWALIDTKNAMTPPGISLGRGSINDVIITEYALSKTHCRFSLDENTQNYLVRDLNSTNGTYLNGRRLGPNDPCSVEHFDIIILGRYQFQYFSSSGFVRELLLRAKTAI